MKKIIYSFLVSFAILNTSYSQNFNWITPNKTYLKLYVTEDGVYRINKQDFTNAGITSSIDPRTVKVLYKGQQLPIYFQGEDDGSFDNNDYFDFFGKRNYGGETKFLDGYSNSVNYIVNEYYNLYSDTSVYWVDWGGSNGLRMEESRFISAVNFPAAYFYKGIHFEKDRFYFLGETLNPGQDYRYFSTELVSGEGWFWRDLSTEQSLTDTFTVNNLSTASQLCSLKVFFYPNSYTNQVLSEHRVELTFNGTVFDTLITENLKRIDTTITFPASLLTNNSLNTIKVRYIPLGGTFFEPHMHIDFFDIYYPRNFEFRNNHVTYNLISQDTSSKKFTIANYNSSNPLTIYDTKNNTRIDTFSISGNTLTFTGKGDANFEIANENIVRKPFRIKQRQVSDLTSGTNGADYLIVYNKVFESQVEQLRNHRQNFDNFRSVKAEVEDIYDIFNFGMEDPIAVRYFLKYVNDNWALPKVKYVCLFGRASLDPKKNDSTSVYYQSFVPTYGNPPTDGYFVNFDFNTYTYYHQLSVGRIPVYTVSEAQSVTEKIINYDLNQPDKWWKQYLAITGGPDSVQQRDFQLKSESLINKYIKPSPMSMSISKIYRRDSSTGITYNYQDSIKKEFNRGAMIVNFIGHAASQNWEIGLEDPNTLNNGNKQPLVLSYTCFTGKNCVPNERSFGETFFLTPNKCAIGFVGTTGWSFSGIGDTYNDYYLREFAKNNYRRIGELLRNASDSLFNDPQNFPTRNTINCYNLIGDPATGLLIPRTPDFDIRQNDYSISNPFPALNEVVNITAFPKNLGIFADSLRIRFRLKDNGDVISGRDTVIRNFGFLDTVNNFFSVDTLGKYSMTIILDPNRTYVQKYTNNDSITIPITLRNLSYVPVKPLNNVALNSPSFKFTGLNPNVDLSQNNVKVILQVDTVNNFNSPLTQTFATSSISGVSTSFNVTVPVTNLNTVYYFRTNALVNNDSSGWSHTQTVIYNPNVSDELADSVYSIFTAKPGQYSESGIVNLNYNNDGFRLGSYTGNLYIRSFGSSSNEASYFSINSINYYSDDGQNTGLNIAKVKKLTGNSPAIKNFRMDSPQSSDSVINFLNTFDTTDYVMAYIASYVPNASISTAAKNKFREFGSLHLDSVRLDFFDNWAFFGFLGATSTQTCENYQRFISPPRLPSDCQINPSFTYLQGYAEQTIGVADKWKSFSWEQNVFPNSTLLYDVYGISSDNIATPLYLNLSSNTLVNLDTINYSDYPNLKIGAKLSIDSISGIQSPVLRSTNFKYYPPAELTPDNYSFTGKDTSVLEGDSVRFKVNYYNIGYIDAPIYTTKWYVKDNYGEVILGIDTISDPLKIDSMRVSEVAFSTVGLRDPKVEFDTIDLYFEVNLPEGKNEIFDYNNTAITQFIVTGDTVNPSMEVTYNGIKIQNGDFVQPNPLIELKFLDNSRMVISDTSNVKVYYYDKNINNYTYVPYFRNGSPNPVISIAFPDNNFLQATVTYKPEIISGEHQFRYVALDNSGNFADTVYNNVAINGDLRIYDMSNYPNPMTTQTNFMFSLSGENNPVSCKVRIFTVAGRMIKEITAPANVGFNNIYWDGKDTDGDYIANGVYMYKFIIEGDSKTETTIQKLVVLR